MTFLLLLYIFIYALFRSTLFLSQCACKVQFIQLAVSEKQKHILNCFSGVHISFFLYVGSIHIYSDGVLFECSVRCTYREKEYNNQVLKCPSYMVNEIQVFTLKWAPATWVWFWVCACVRNCKRKRCQKMKFQFFFLPKTKMEVEDEISCWQHVQNFASIRSHKQTHTFVPNI